MPMIPAKPIISANSQASRLRACLVRDEVATIGPCLLDYLVVFFAAGFLAAGVFVAAGLAATFLATDFSVTAST